MAALLRPGDEVIVEEPVYEPLLQAAELTGARTVRLDRKFTDAYQIDMELLKSLINEKTHMLVISNLHNPSGVLLDNASLKSIAEQLATVSARLLVDEVYLDFIFDNHPGSAFHLADNIIVSSSLTKVYGLGPLRSGYLLADEGTVKRCKQVSYVMGVETPHISNYLAAKIMTGPQLSFILEKVKNRVAENKPLIKEFFARAEEIELVLPDYGIIAFPRFRQPLSSTRFNEELKIARDVQVTPGLFFENNQHFRIGFGLKPELLKEGLQKLESFLYDFS